MSQLVEVRTYQRMRAMVNPKNPSFDSYTGERNRSIEVHAIISDGTKSWRESFKVSNKSVAEEQIREVIKFFNDTRLSDPPMEKERAYVGLYNEEEEVAQYEDDRGMSGWLDPEGVFHPCGFGEHVQYALDLYNRGQEQWKSCSTDEMESLLENQHISMSNGEQSNGGFISILGKLTLPQIEWFNRFFFKLSPTQRWTVVKVAREQGIELKYDW